MPVKGTLPAEQHTAGSLVVALYAGYQISAHWSLELAVKTTTFKKTYGSGLGHDTALNYAMPVVSVLAGFTF